MVLLTIFLGLATAAMWGASGWALTKSHSSSSAFSSNVALHLTSTLFMLPGLLFFDLEVPSLRIAGLIVLIGFTFAAAWLFFTKALKMGPIGLVDPIANSYGLFTLLIAIIVLGEVLTKLQLAGALVVLVGVILASRHKKTGKGKRLNLRQCITFSLLSALTWGVSFSLIPPVTNELSWFWTLFYGKIATLTFVILLGAYRYGAKSLMSMHTDTIKIGSLSGLLLLVGSIAFYVGIERNLSIAILVVLSAASPLFSSILGYVFNRERLGLARRLGAVVIVVGIMVLSL